MLKKMNKRFLVLMVSLLSVATVAYGLTVNGELKKALLEKLASDPSSYEGRVYYNTVDKTAKIYNGSAWSGLGGGGSSGEKNYIEGSSLASGWSNVGDVDVASTSTAAELPRENTTATGIKITADSNTQSVADYVYNDFTLDDVDLSKKLKISWSQKVTGTYTAGQLAVVITTQADRTTAVATPVTTAIPAADGVFSTTFDASTTATLSLVIRATADMTTDGGVVISDVVVGPGTQPQGAVISDWVSFTPTGSWSVNTTYTGKWRRVGDSMDIQVKVATAGAPTTATLTINMPTGYTIDTSKLAETGDTRTALGFGDILDGGVNQYAGSVLFKTTSSVYIFYLDDGAAAVVSGAVTQAAPFTWGNTDTVNIQFRVPVAEWSGSGTINVVASNDCEYAYNTTTSDATDTTAFGYGPGGNTVPSVTTSAKLKRVRFQYPIQASDRIMVELAKGSGAWYEAAVSGYQNGIGALQNQSTNTYGVGVDVTNIAGGTDVDVVFGIYAGNTGVLYAATGSAWSGNTTYKWRLKKCAGGQVVGFGSATSTSAGLIDTTTQTFAGAKTFSGTMTLSNDTGGLHLSEPSGSTGAGMFAISTASSATACQTSCADNTAGDSSHGFDSASGHCLFAWNQATGASITCTDTTGSVVRTCLCVGF